MFFVRSGLAGYVYSGDSWGAGNGLTYPGNYAWYWSRSSYDSASAFYLDIGNTFVRPSNYSRRYIGRSLRCLYHHVK